MNGTITHPNYLLKQNVWRSSLPKVGSGADDHVSEHVKSLPTHLQRQASRGHGASILSQASQARLSQTSPMVKTKLLKICSNGLTINLPNLFTL